MRCYNCNKEIPDQAAFCRFCEANQREMAELLADDRVAESLEAMPPDAMAALRELAESCDTAEELANAIFVGACPTCESENVGTYEDVAGIEDCTVARCFACGHEWCTECRQPIADAKQICAHWAVCDECGKDEDCPDMGDVTECHKIRRWLKSRR